MIFLCSKTMYASSIADLFLPYIQCAMIAVTTRETDLYDNECKFCAHEAKNFVAHVNTKICPECYSWVAESVGLTTLGIRPSD